MVNPFTPNFSSIDFTEPPQYQMFFCIFLFTILGIYPLYAPVEGSFDLWTKVVPNEFILVYNKPVNCSTRRPVIRMISKTLYIKVSVLPRCRLQPDLQSSTDFDVIRVENVSITDVSTFIASITRFPGIKSASVERQFHRRLMNQNESPFQTATNDSLRRLNLFGGSWMNEVPGTVPLDSKKQPWRLLRAEELWKLGFCGQGVRIGIFDTGIVDPGSHPHFLSTQVKERTDWTHVDPESKSENKFWNFLDTRHLDISDGHGHGTFVAGILVASTQDSSSSSFFDYSYAQCPTPGLTPRAELYIFRVFTDSQVSYTSWFLDAFNHAITRRLHIINLSIGGPDFLDRPFVDKVRELSSNGILLISAIGNDGPLFGTLNNPADQMDVLGVGGIDALGRIARFSSRGMAAWTLPHGYGQFKPDIVAYSTGVISSTLDGRCRTLSGTSVASPIVTGMVALLINSAMYRNSQLRKNNHSHLIPINPASIKQTVIAGATPLEQVQVFGTDPIRWPDSVDRSGIFEQGAGLVDLIASHKIMQRIQPQASLFPSYLDLTQCPYMWPFCSQAFYYTMQPVVVNVTILNSMGVTGRLLGVPVYHPYLDRDGDRLLVGFSYPEQLWPWSGYLSLHLEVAEIPNGKPPSSQFSGTAEGFVTLTIVTDYNNATQSLQTHLRLPIRAQIIPTPSRSRRILFDQFHSIRYPPGFIPRDDLTRANQQLDWLGDHMHTNLRDLYMHLRKANYYVEILSSPYTCFNARNYGTLLIVDPEDEFFPAEIDKLYADVLERRLSVVVFAEWYNTSVMNSLQFFETNTRRMWSPDTGGSNLPALNNLLHPFGIEFGDRVYAGELHFGHRLVHFTSGTSLRRFPARNISTVQGLGSIYRAPLVDIGGQLIENTAKSKSPDVGPFRLTANARTDPKPPVLGLWSPRNLSSNTGRLAVHGDADCLSSTHLETECFWLVDAILQFVSSPIGRIPRPLHDLMIPATDGLLDPRAGRPIRPPISSLYRSSNVVRPSQPYSPLLNGSLPPEAFQPLPDCPKVNPGPVSPISNFSLNSSIYAPQPLLLYPLVPLPPPATSPRSCYSGIDDSHTPTAFSMVTLIRLVLIYVCLFLLAAFLARLCGPYIRRGVWLASRLTIRTCWFLVESIFRRHRPREPHAQRFDPTDHLYSLSS